MKRLAWLTDIHLDFLNLQQIQNFCYKALQANPDAFIISGDISIAPALHTHLRIIEHYWRRPIYFVLGNHDYYKSSIEKVRSELPSFLHEHENLKWLPNEGVVELSESTALIGHGGWADGRAGLGVKSQILLNDYALIEELTGHEQNDLYRILNSLGDRSANELEPILNDALERYQHVYVVTHAPPFVGAAWFKNQISDGQFLPHMVNVAIGTMLKKVMMANKGRKMTVLCGHTHGAGETSIAENLLVKTGGARYSHPRVNEIISLD